MHGCWIIVLELQIAAIQDIQQIYALAVQGKERHNKCMHLVIRIQYTIYSTRGVVSCYKLHILHSMYTLTIYNLSSYTYLTTIILSMHLLVYYIHSY